MVLSEPSAALLFHPSTRPPPNPRIALREISPSLGRGWFAVQDLPAGAVLWQESPKAVATSRSDLIQLVHENLNDFQHLCHYNDNDNDNGNESSASKQIAIAESIVRCNHFEHSQEQVLLFDEISLLNHSCNPNASISIRSTCEDEAIPNQCSVDQKRNSKYHDNTETYIQAIVQTGRTIAAGEEITISYTDEALFWPTKGRRELLQSRWGFSCACERCRCPSDDPEKAPVLLAEVWPLLERAAAVSARSKPRDESVDPACLQLQLQAAEAVAEYMPHLKQCRRFQSDAEYFR